MVVNVVTVNNEYSSATKLGYPTHLYLPIKTQGHVIRWGIGDGFGSHSDYDNVLNPAKAVRLNCHKLKALLEMSKVVDTSKIFKKRIPKNVTALIRPFSHANGKNFKVVTGSATVPSRHYATEWITTNLEYRVWFAWDKTLIAERINEGHDTSNSAFPCRSQWGYKFTTDSLPLLHDATMRAKKAIGLDLGAADVLVKNDRYIFLELNSAPTIDDNKICKFYKTAISAFIENHQLITV